jgi:hypothetical protein
VTPSATPAALAASSLQGSVDRASRFLFEQAKTRTPHASSSLVPDDMAIDRTASGPWTGTFSLPGNHASHASVPYTPVLIKGPLCFPIAPGRPVTFHGTVDFPFVSLYGPAGVRLVEDRERGGELTPDRSTLFADHGRNWGSFFVVGSVASSTQFIARVLGNATFQASLVSPLNGSWSFQLITYATESDAKKDTDRILIGQPWLESERPGDVRLYYAVAYFPRAPIFTNVALSSAEGASAITGNIGTFAVSSSHTYKVLVTSESDVEYAWALEDAEIGPFSIAKPRAFGGKIKLRLIELDNGCACRVVGQVWAEENAVVQSSWPDLRIEYRCIAKTIPASPTSVVPASLDGTWSVELVPPGIGRVSLVDVSTKRIYGEYTMPSGLLRSYNVPAADAGQTLGEIYYDDFNDVCFLYDQAVCLIAFLQLGERDAARRLVEALLDVQNPDGSFPFANHQAILWEHNRHFIRIGAVAWVCYALLLCDKSEFRGWFPRGTSHAARNSLDFLLTYRNDLGLLDGGKGRYVGLVLDPDYVLPWWSTEHNIDTWWCFDLAANLYGGARDKAVADQIRAALQTVGWNPANNIFWQGGICRDGNNVPDRQHALDMMTWGSVALVRWGRLESAAAAIERMFRLYHVVDESTGLSGFTTFVAADGYPVGTVVSPWYEGSFGAVVALRMIDPARANALMAVLVKAQSSDGSYPYALRADPINEIHALPGIIGPAWSVLAYSGAMTGYAQILWA